MSTTRKDKPSNKSSQRNRKADRRGRMARSRAERQYLPGPGVGDVGRPAARRERNRVRGPAISHVREVFAGLLRIRDRPARLVGGRTDREQVARVGPVQRIHIAAVGADRKPPRSEPDLDRRADGVGGRAHGADGGFGEFLLSPAVTVGCRIAMSVTMAFMLLIMI